MKKLAQQADRYELYEESVQNVEFEVSFYKKMFKRCTNRDAVSLREDFCASAKISVEWVKKSASTTSYAVDLDKKVLDYAKNIIKTVINAGYDENPACDYPGSSFEGGKFVEGPAYRTGSHSEQEGKQDNRQRCPDSV